MRHFAAPVLAFLALAHSLVAEPLSKKTDIDFFRDVLSRNLKGLATRSDGRLVAGPTLTEVATPPLAEILWCLEPAAETGKWLVGTGPEGKILEVNFNSASATYTSRELAKLDDPQVFALRHLADGSILAGTSPKGALYLIRDGKPAARVALPVDSIFDLLLLDENTALVATGNPGRIYRIDLQKFSASGVIVDKISDTKLLAEHGIALFGEVRDRNVRRIAQLADGRIVAGSAPKGNIYTFASPSAGDAAPSPRAPVILQENRDAEITDLLPQPNGDLYAAVVFASTTGESRITPAPKSTKDKDASLDLPPPSQPEKFGGRSALVWFPANGFPETLASRSSTAFYRLARHGDVIVMAGGEAGELLGYDLKERLSLTFSGSISAQLSGLAPVPGSPDKFLVLRNNAPGFAVLDFAATGVREAETRRIDLSVPSLLGALRFNRLRNLADNQLALEIKTSNGSDEIEGWGPWTALAVTDGGWRADALRGRYVKLRLRLPAGAATPPSRLSDALEIDKASLFALPQDRRPTLQDFRLLTPGFGLIPAVEQPPSASVALSQLIQGGARDEEGKRRSNFLGSQVVPSPGTQVVFWTVSDPDGDTVQATFSIRREGDEAWIDVAANTRDSYAQFDTAHLPEGVYFTRLVATETAPRATTDRLTATFETDDLIVDHTPPEILSATASRTGDRVIVTVHGRDALSLLDSIEVVFNNGVHETVEQPVDGIRDSRDESFTLDLSLAKVSNATSAEVTLYDAAGNGVSRRVTW